MAKEEVCNRATDGPEGKQLREVVAQQHPDAREKKRGDGGVKSRGARLGTTHDLVPTEHPDDAQLDREQGGDRELVGMQDELDAKGLEVGRATERDRKVEVLIGRDKRRRPPRQAP